MNTKDTDDDDRQRNWLYRLGRHYLRAMAMTAPVGMLGGWSVGQAETRQRRSCDGAGNYEGEQKRSVA